MLLVTFPGPLGGDPFPGDDRGKAPQDRNGLLASLHLDLQDTKPVLLVVEGHPFHLAAQGVVRTSGHRLGVRFLAERSAQRHGLPCHGIEFPPILRSVEIEDRMRRGAGDDDRTLLGISIPAATHAEALAGG